MQVGGDNPGLVLDHNLYVAQYVGRRGDDPASVSIRPGGTRPADRRDSLQSGPFADADTTTSASSRHSTGTPPRRPPATGARPASREDRPAADIAGMPRVGLPTRAHSRPGRSRRPLPWHYSRSSSPTDRSSAGLFRPEGTLVRYLFEDLPLPAGTHGFTLPSQDSSASKIEPGRY